MRRIRIVTIIALLILPGIPLGAQTAIPAPQASQANGEVYAALTAVGVVREKDNAAIEIVLTRPVVPTIQRMEGPPRLVIDLPKTRIATGQKRISVGQLQINTIRMDQLQGEPPAVRVIADLAENRNFTWDRIGNRLRIHLSPVPGATPAANPQPATPSVIGLPSGPEPAVVPVTSGNSGTAVLASRVAAGSSITAGAETTILRLSRGGEIRVCPGTTVSVTSSRSGRDLMLGMSTGNMEAHYKLDASADSILTPDFRILMPGPGEFDYAISADARGNTCVRTLPGNTASAVISELMGDRTYMVRPHDELLIHSGQLDKVDTAGPFDCGCPPASIPVLRASDTNASVPSVIPDDKVPSAMTLGGSQPRTQPVTPAPEPQGAPAGAKPTLPTVAVTGPETAPLPPPGPRDMKLRIEAPLVYRATDPPPAPTAETKRLPIMTVAPQQKFQTLVLAPPAQPKRGATKPARHGFFGKLKGLFSAMFG